MSTRLFPLKKALQVFGQTPDSLEANGFNLAQLPPPVRSEGRKAKIYGFAELIELGKTIGYLTSPARPLVVSVFVTKGGVLKSSLTLNLARSAALHGIKTCVVGLDMQGDVSTALESDFIDADESFEQAVDRMGNVRGLSSVFTGEADLSSVVQKTEMSTLCYIPETPELVALDQSLVNRNRREYWLEDNVIAPLKKEFELILLDGSPSWNRLTTNALVSCDVLLSPLECKINNFRNFKTFAGLVSEFKNEMRAGFKQIYVPTKYNASRKLSREILEWYRNLPECTDGVIRESMQGEEAIAMRMSIPEYAPSSVAAEEMRNLIGELWLQMTASPRPNVMPELNV